MTTTISSELEEGDGDTVGQYMDGEMPMPYYHNDSDGHVGAPHTRLVPTWWRPICLRYWCERCSQALAMDKNSVHNTVVGHNCTYHTIDMQYYGCYRLIECRKAYQEPLSDADSQHTLQLWAYHAILRQDYLKNQKKLLPMRSIA